MIKMVKSFFTTINPNDYKIFSGNGNQHALEFRKAFQTSFIQFVFGSDVVLYELYFENTLIVSDAVDLEIFSMVEGVLLDFMSRHENDLVYYSISRTDGRNLQLFRLYSIWFKKICQKCDWLAKTDKILLENNITIDHISCIYPKKAFNNVNINDTIDNILMELYPQCFIVTP